jgi:hypothetical protein
MGGTALNRLIEDFNELSIEDREFAVELMQRQLVETRRERIVSRKKEAMANLRKGKVETGSVEDLFKDLENLPQ